MRRLFALAIVASAAVLPAAAMTLPLAAPRLPETIPLLCGFDGGPNHYAEPVGDIGFGLNPDRTPPTAWPHAPRVRADGTSAPGLEPADMSATTGAATDIEFVVSREADDDGAPSLDTLAVAEVATDIDEAETAALDDPAAEDALETTGSVPQAGDRAGIPADPMQRSLDDYRRIFGLRSRLPAQTYTLGGVR